MAQGIALVDWRMPDIGQAGGGAPGGRHSLRSPGQHGGWCDFVLRPSVGLGLNVPSTDDQQIMQQRRPFCVAAELFEPLSILSNFNACL